MTENMRLLIERLLIGNTLNGIPSKPFPAKKVLRQEDPLSPFLFAISMEYLRRCIDELTEDPDFNFHPKCERLELTHLMFADNLLLFAREDHRSVTKIMKAFRKFSRAFGLEASIEKSCIYFAGVRREDATDIV